MRTLDDVVVLTDGGHNQPDASWLMSMVHRFLGVPIFYKVLLANSLIVILGAVVGTLLTVQYSPYASTRSNGELVILFALVGITLSVLVNFVVLKAAFLPLASLECVVEEVRRGNLAARVGYVLFSDPQIDQLIDTVNSMLDGLETYREQVRSLSQQVLAAQEAERQRIARELHDETAQSLTSLLIGLRRIEKVSSPQELATLVADLRNQAVRTLEEVRKLAVDLRPSALDDLGLAAALQWYTDNFTRQTRIPVEFHSSGLDQRVPDAVEVVVYRIVQEALTNVAKHADATRVDVSITRDGGWVFANIMDNGRGFDVEGVMRSHERGLGLFGIHERVALVGGHCQILSHPGSPARSECSTRVAVSIPLEG